MAGWLITLGYIVLGQVAPIQIDSSPSHIDSLIKQLESDDEHIRRSAIESLTAIGPAARKAIPALELLPQEDGRVLDAFRKIGPGPEPFVYSISQEVLGSERPDVLRKQYLLHIDETGQDIPLGSTREYAGEEQSLQGDKEGMDIESLLIRWLEPKRLLHIHWTTISIGGGDFEAQGNLILLMSEGVWHEILRDWCEYSYHGGASDNSNVRLNFRWDQQRNLFSLEGVSSLSVSGGLRGPGPLVEAYSNGDGGTNYYCEYQIVKAWDATIIDEKLAFKPGVVSLGLKPASGRNVLNDPWFSVRSAAEFVAKSSEFCTGRGPVEELNYILQHHPDLRSDSPCPERLVVGDGIAPFVPNKAEIFRTGDNTSW